MSTDNSLISGNSEPTSADPSAETQGGAKLPPLPAGYHFIVSLCNVGCTREQLDLIREDLIDVVRSIVQAYDLRADNGQLINTRVHLSRTARLLDEEETDRAPETRSMVRNPEKAPVEVDDGKAKEEGAYSETSAS